MRDSGKNRLIKAKKDSDYRNLIFGIFLYGQNHVNEICGRGGLLSQVHRHKCKPLFVFTFFLPLTDN